MRLYSLTNYYLSATQHGIQTAHLVSELSRLDRAGALGKGKRSASAVFREWADNHKTIIVLNGGNSARLRYFHNALISSTLDQKTRIADHYPVVHFTEDADSLDGAWTAVGVILPESVYYAGALPQSDYVIDQILSLPLAR
jgi:hypothetical protein